MVAAGHPASGSGGGLADAVALRTFHLLSGLADTWFLAGAGSLAPPPGVRIFQPFGPAEFLAEAEGGFEAMDLTQPDLNLLERLGELLERLMPEVVHLHDIAPFGLEFLALVRRVLPQARIVLTLEAGLAHRIGITAGPQPEDEKVPRFLGAAMLRRFLRDATTLVPNEPLRAACLGFGLDAARVMVAPPLPPEVKAKDPPPSRHFLVAAAFPGPEDMAQLAAAAGLLASLPLPEGRRLRIEVQGGEGTVLERAAALPGSPLVLDSGDIAAAHLVLLPSRDPEVIAALAAAHGRPAIRIGSGAALAEGLMLLLEAPGELAALQAALAPPGGEAAALLALYQGLPA